MKKLNFLPLFTLMFIPSILFSQIEENKLGAWYMYFYNTSFNENGKWGLQGDIQHRNWNLGGDLEQLLVRSGLTFKPENANVKLTLGYGNITSGAYGDSKDVTVESRIYQEALFPVQFGKRVYTNHRFRYEQRFVQNQNFRTRYRYNFFMNIPLNQPNMSQNSIYLALYNEIFINGQRDIGSNNTVEVFDRNRFYSAIGYVLNDNLKIQVGHMIQTTNSWQKKQIQMSLHHKF